MGPETDSKLQSPETDILLIFFSHFHCEPLSQCLNGQLFLPKRKWTTVRDVPKSYQLAGQHLATQGRDVPTAGSLFKQNGEQLLLQPLREVSVREIPSRWLKRITPGTFYFSQLRLAYSVWKVWFQKQGGKDDTVYLIT